MSQGLTDVTFNLADDGLLMELARRPWCATEVAEVIATALHTGGPTSNESGGD